MMSVQCTLCGFATVRRHEKTQKFEKNTTQVAPRPVFFVPFWRPGSVNNGGLRDASHLGRGDTTLIFCSSANEEIALKRAPLSASRCITERKGAKMRRRKKMASLSLSLFLLEY